MSLRDPQMEFRDKLRRNQVTGEDALSFVAETRQDLPQHAESLLSRSQKVRYIIAQRTGIILDDKAMQGLLAQLDRVNGKRRVRTIDDDELAALMGNALMNRGDVDIWQTGGTVANSYFRGYHHANTTIVLAYASAKRLTVGVRMVQAQGDVSPGWAWRSLQPWRPAKTLKRRVSRWASCSTHDRVVFTIPNT